MSDVKMSQMNPLTDLSSLDELFVLDKSDTTDSLQGTLKRMSMNTVLEFLNANNNPLVENPYLTITAMLADQANQTFGRGQYVSDASLDPTVTSGSAYYEYLGTTNGNLTDYRKLSENEAEVFFDITPYNQVKVVSVLETETTSVADIGVAVRYSTDDITELVFNEQFSKYLQAYLSLIATKDVSIKLYNKTQVITLIANVETITNNIEETNVYTKVTLEAGALVENIAEGDVLLVDLDFNIKNNQITTTVADYNFIPLSTGAYYAQVAYINTNAKRLDTDAAYLLYLTNITVYRTQQTITEGSYVQYIDRIYKGNHYLGSRRIDVYGGGSTVTEGLMALSVEAIPYGYYVEDVQIGYNNYSLARFEIDSITDEMIEKEGLLKMPYNFFCDEIKEVSVILGGKEVDVEFVYISDSDNETIKLYIRGKNGETSKDNLLNQKLTIDLYYNNFSSSVFFLQDVTPITENFASSIENRGIVISDVNLSHSNKLKTWISEYITNNLTGSVPTITGYEESGLGNKLGSNYYRLDTMYQFDSDLMIKALASTNIIKNDRDKNTFKIIGHGSNSVTQIDRTSTIDDFIEDTVLVTSREETDNDGTDPEGTSYGFGVEFNEPTDNAALTAIGLTLDIDTHQQSPATAIVTAKFKWLRNETGAPWGLIREACRATASNAGSYNIYRGFGQIDTAAAKTYIETNIDTWTGVNTTELAEYYDAISPYNTDVKLSEKTDKTPMTKGDYVSDKAYLSGRIGSAIINPTAPIVLKFDEFWSDNGNINYDAATGHFTFTKAGVYNISFNGLTEGTNARLQLLKNSEVNNNLTNIGQSYSPSAYTNIDLNTTYEFAEGDYIVFKLAAGYLRNTATEKFNEFSIIKIS